jgi:pimeloyl-ACP methyl ester carboxylesterase
MATRLIVRFGNTGHRFIKTTTVELGTGGPPAPELKGSTLGKHIFDIPAASVGSSFSLKIQIPAPPVLAAAGVKTLLDVKQVLEVVRTPAGVVSLVPHKTNPGNRFVGGFHPRLTGHLENSGSGHNFFVTLDNTFLDVTELARRGNPDYLKPYDAAVPAIAGAAPHYGAKLFLLEYTGGKPTLWAVVVPDAVKPDRKTVHALLFFRPIGDQPQQYTFIDQPPLLKPRPLNRYLLDPPPPPPPTVTGRFFVVQIGGAKKLTKVQFCGFERQVAEAKKPLIFVTPVPDGGAFGDSSNGRWSSLMPSLMWALWAEDAVGKSVAQGLKLGKLAIGGFSFGAMVALAALTVHPEVTDEVYLFDPPKFGPEQTGIIKPWLGRGGKRLRLIGGGMSHELLINFAATNGPDVTVNPTSLDYWIKNPLYLAAVNMTRFDPSTVVAAGTKTISNLTGLFFVGPASKGIGIAMQGRSRTNNIVVSSRNVSGFGHEELAADTASYVDCFLDSACKALLDKEFAKLKDTSPVIPINSSAEFNHLISGLTRRVKAMRHQWVVVGGEDSAGNTDRLATFKGFLQLCIEQGNFP